MLDLKELVSNPMANLPLGSRTRVLVLVFTMVAVVLVIFGREYYRDWQMRRLWTWTRKPPPPPEPEEEGYPYRPIATRAPKEKHECNLSHR